jgi:hypothetical protein
VLRGAPFLDRTGNILIDDLIGAVSPVSADTEALRKWPMNFARAASVYVIR